MSEKFITSDYRNCCFPAVILFIAAMATAASAFASNDAKGGKDQTKHMMQRQHALEQEKNQLAQDKAVLETDLKDAKDKLAEAEKTKAVANRLTRDLKTVNDEKAAMAQKLSDTETRLADTEKKLVQTTEKLRNTESVAGQLDANLTARSQNLSACEQKNDKMYQAGMELLDRYSKKSCFSSAMQNEPFLQFKRVQIENTVEEYREKFDQQKLTASSPASAQDARR